MSEARGDGGASKSKATGNRRASNAGAPRVGGVARTLTRIVGYYVLLLAALATLLWAYPWLTQAITDAGGESAFTGEITRTFGGVPLEEPISVQGWEGLAVQGLSLLGALAIMMPVAWTYIIIKRRGGYDQSVVHTLIILPVAVTGIVIIVQTSLALAFSLAGIVAAVRFRTTLEDMKDAVYVFLAIGVGLAAGSQRLGTALLASMVFNIVNLVLWKMKFGNIYVDQLHRTSALGLGDVLAGPGSSETALSIGDEALLTAMPQSDLREMVGRVARLERYLDEETDVQTEKNSTRSCLSIRNSPARHRRWSRARSTKRPCAGGWPRSFRGRTVRPSFSTWSGSNPVCSPASCWTRFARRVATTSRRPSYGHSGVEPNGRNRHDERLSRTALLCGGARFNRSGGGVRAGYSPRGTTDSSPLLLP